MLGAPDTWHALMTKLTDLTIAFLRTQLAAGVDAIQVFDSWAGTLSLADYRAYVLPHSSRVFDGAGRRRCADDALRGGHRRAAGRDVGRRGHRRRRGLAHVADRRRRQGPARHRAAGQPRPGGAVRGLAGGGAGGARRRRGRPACRRRGRGRPCVQPRPRGAARHRPGRDHRRRGAWCIRCDCVVLRCRRRDFGSGRGVPAAGDGGTAGVDHAVRSRRSAGRCAAHRASGRAADRRRRRGVRRPPARGAGAAGRAGTGRQAGRHHRCAAADLQRGPAAPDAARTRCRASRRRRRRWSGWSTTRRSRAWSTSATARCVAPRRRIRRWPIWSATGSASRWWRVPSTRCWPASTPDRLPPSACARPSRRWPRCWTAARQT